MRTTKKLILFLVLCLTVLGCQAALADGTISPVPADRLQVVMEPGLVLNSTNTKTQDGNLHLQIDTEKTDWPKVLGYGGLGEGDKNLGAKVLLPTNAKYYIVVNMSTNTPTYSEALEAAMTQEQEEASFGYTAYRLIDTAEGTPSCQVFFLPYRDYNMQEGVLTLYEVNAPGCAVICYFDEDKNPLFAESLRCTLDFTSDQSQKVKPHCVSLSFITPDDSVNGISSALTDGELVYSIYDPTSVSVSAEWQSLITRVEVPKGTKKVVKYNYWGIEYDTIFPSADGTFDISTPYVSNGKLFEGTNSKKYSYAFMDENDNILEGGGLLYITLVNESNNKLALNFLKDKTWNPIPKSRFRYAIKNDNNLLKITYEEALAHLSTKEQTGFTDADARKLPLATKEYEVQAPAGAKAYRFCALGDENCFGPANATRHQSDLNGELKKQSVLPVQEGQWVSLIPSGWGKSVFYTASTSNKGIELYAVAAESGMGRASFFAVEWFGDAEGQNSLGVEWFGENADPLTLKPNTYMVSDAAQVASQLDGPAVVYQSDDLILYAEYRAQSGENAYVIDLKLTDLDGYIIKDFSRLTADGAVEFFIPYPQGLSVNSDYTYSVTHYLDDELNQSESVLEMSREVGGIRFKVTSLSPIDLSWQSNAPVVSPQTPPKTGDNAHILLWFSLSLVSLAAAAALLKKHRKA